MRNPGRSSLRTPYGTISIASLGGFRDRVWVVRFPRIEMPDWANSFLWLLCSAACSGFGNSLEPVSALAILQSFFLLVGFNKLTTQVNIWIAILVTLIIEAVGSTVAFATLFSAGNDIGTTIGYALGFGSGIWFLVIIFALLPHHFYLLRFKYSRLSPFVYPICNTVIMHTVVGNILSTFPSFANAVLDYEPLRQLSVIFGLAGINFIAVSIGTVLSFHWIETNIVNFKHMQSTLFMTGIVLAVLGGFIQVSNQMYQKDVSLLITPMLNVSCIFGQGEKVSSHGWDHIWKNTETKLLAGDQIVLWSETAVYVANDFEESILLQKAMTVMITTSMLSLSKFTTYLGITYTKNFPSYQTNQFALISCHNGTAKVVWNYHKAHPVPIIESTVQAGNGILPTHSSPYGTLGGAICFDLDYPQYIHQASVSDVSIMLQPSWTWGALSTRHFNGNAIRALENGFTLFRCSSDGVSGVVSPKGRVLGQAFTGHNPAVSVSFSVPLQPAVQTPYKYVGFAFDWVCLGVMCMILLTLLLPLRVVTRADNMARRSVEMIAPPDMFTNLDSQEANFERRYSIDSGRRSIDSHAPAII